MASAISNKWAVPFDPADPVNTPRGVAPAAMPAMLAALRGAAEKLQSLGIPAASHDPPRTLAARVREQLGSAGEPLGRLLDELEAQRYGRSSATRPDTRLTRDFVAQARLLRTAAA